MRNSKLLSILTAGALAVSSFSGLILNDGVALAADDTITLAASGNVKKVYGESLTALADGPIEDRTILIKNSGAGDTVATLDFGTSTEGAVNGNTKFDTFASGTLEGKASAAGTALDGKAAKSITATSKASGNGADTVYYGTGTTTPTIAGSIKIVGFDSVVTTNGTTDADKSTVSIDRTGSVSFQVNSKIVENAPKATYAWTSSNTTSFKLTGEKSSAVTVSATSSAVDGDTTTLTLTAGNLTGTVTVKIGDSIAKTVASSKLVEGRNNTDVTGGKVEIQNNEYDETTKTDYASVVVSNDVVINASDASVKWCDAKAQNPATPTYAWTVKELKVDGTKADVNDFDKYFTMTPATSKKAARFDFVSAATKGVEAVIEVSVEGTAGTIAAAASIPDYYKGMATFTLSVVPARSFTWSIDKTPKDTPIEAGSDSTVLLESKLSNVKNMGRFPESGLYYTWETVDKNLIKTVTDDKTADDKKAGTYSTNVQATYTLVTGAQDGSNVFELDGAADHGSKIKVKAMSTASANTYGILVRLYGNEAEAKKSAYNYLDEKLVTVTVVNSGLTVTLDSAKVGTDGVVAVPAGAADFANVIKVTSSANTDLTKTATVRAYNYETYLNTLQTAGTEAQAVASLWATAPDNGISCDKGTLKVSAKAVSGTYVVIAKDTNLGVVGVSNEYFIVKDGSGKDVTSVSVEPGDVILTNKNDEATIYATVLPVVYLANGYTANKAESAEIAEIAVSSDNENVAVAKVVVGGRKPVGATGKKYDNTREILITAKGAGKANVTVMTLDGNQTATVTVNVLNEGDPVTPEPEPTPEPEHKAGDAFTVDGVSVFVNADGKTLTVTDVAVVGKTATIPATVDGLEVTTIAAQAFKKSDAKTIYVKAAVTDIEKGAFKKAKTKKIFFYEPAALNTVAKNAFKGANVKVVGVGGSFSESAASQLKKAGASKVKNNGTAK